MRRRLRILIAAAAGSLLSLPAAAATIVVSFTATIDEVGSEVASAFTLGDSITGSITIDTAVADFSSADATIGTYFGAITDLSFGFGTYTAAADTGQVDVLDGADDRFNPRTFDAMGASVGGLGLVSAQIILTNFGGALFSSDAIPTTLSLSDFGFARAFLEFDRSGPTRRVAGNLDSLVVVPEPSTLALVLFGLISLAARQRAGSTFNPGGAPRA